MADRSSDPAPTSPHSTTYQEIPPSHPVFHLGHPSDPPNFGLPHWTLLGSVRAHWATERARLDTLDPTPEERAALEPLIRRKAVLAATDELATEMPVWVALVIVAGLAAVPTATLLATGRDLSVTTFLLTYLFYLLSMIPWLVASVTLLITFEDFLDDRPGWLKPLLWSAIATGISVGLALLFIHLRQYSSNLLTGVFSATLFIALTGLLLAVEAPRSEERHRKRFGALGLNSTAALVLLAEWELLAVHRLDWRTGPGRKSLTKGLRVLIKHAATQLERSAAVNHGDAAARRWAEQYVVRLTTTVRDHCNHLLLIDQQSSYDELIASVRRTMLQLAVGAWDTVGPAGDLLPRITWRRRLIRFVPAVVLGLAAVLVGAVPGIDSGDLLTVRLSLLVPAALSLLPVGQLGRSTLSDAFRDAVGRLGS